MGERTDVFLAPDLGYATASWLPALAEAGSGASARICLASRVTDVLLVNDGGLRIDERYSAIIVERSTVRRDRRYAGAHATGLARSDAVCYSAPPASAAQEKLNEIK
jgi:hypothetical protein